MPKIDPFEHYTSQYEDWFSKNEFVYKSEVEAMSASNSITDSPELISTIVDGARDFKIPEQNDAGERY